MITRGFETPLPYKGRGAGGLGFWRLSVSSNTLWLTPRYAFGTLRERYQTTSKSHLIPPHKLYYIIAKIATFSQTITVKIVR
jgi:hypothetical protein